MYCYVHLIDIPLLVVYVLLHLDNNHHLYFLLPQVVSFDVYIYSLMLDLKHLDWIV